MRVRSMYMLNYAWPEDKLIRIVYKILWKFRNFAPRIFSICEFASGQENIKMWEQHLLEVQCHNNNTKGLSCWEIIITGPTTALQCTMAQALKEFGIKDFAKIMSLAPIFSSQNYFRWKYLDVFFFTVSLSIYIWVRIENSLLQQ